MEKLNVLEARRFSRERASRVHLFDRPRIVCDLICLEPNQAERRETHAGSDVLCLIIEGRAAIRTGGATTEATENETVIIPPGVDHAIANPGPGRLTVMLMITPKPTRTSEVRLPADRAPQANDHGRRNIARERDGGQAALRGRPAAPPEGRGRRAGPPRGRGAGDEGRGQRGGGSGRRPPGGGGLIGPPGGPYRVAPSATSGRPGRPAGRGGSSTGDGRGGRPQGQRGAGGVSRRPLSGDRNGRPGQGRSGPRTSGRRSTP